MRLLTVAKLDLAEFGKGYVKRTAYDANAEQCIVEAKVIPQKAAHHAKDELGAFRKIINSAHTVSTIASGTSIDTQSSSFFSVFFFISQLTLPLYDESASQSSVKLSISRRSSAEMG